MSDIGACAAAAISTFPNVLIRTLRGLIPYPVVMVAIAGAESSWNVQAAGDYGDPGPGCGGSTSWGLWQIHNVHAAYLQQQTGSTDPCQWAAWCYDPENCAQAALALVGPNPSTSALADTWTTFGNGAWAAHISAAQTAVTAAYAAVAGSGGGSGGSGSGGSGGGGPNPTPSPAPAWRNPAIAIGGLALAAAAVAAVEWGVYEAVASAAAKAARRVRRAVGGG